VGIVHVYGWLGSPWVGSADYLPYKAHLGDAAHYAAERWVREAAVRIKVIPEGRDEGPSLAVAKEALAAAKQICILGFGFDETKLRRVGTPNVFNEGAGTKLAVAPPWGLRLPRRCARFAGFTESTLRT